MKTQLTVDSDGHWHLYLIPETPAEKNILDTLMLGYGSHASVVRENDTVKVSVE